MTKKDLLAEVARLRKITLDMAMDSTSVTDVKFIPFSSAFGSSSNVRVTARVTINNCILIHVRVLGIGNNFYIGYPVENSCPITNDLHLVTPLTRKLRDEIESKVLGEYKKLIGYKEEDNA